MLLWKKSNILSALAPTSIEEATEQFDKCLDEMDGHRKNLVVQWWRIFNEFTIMRPWTVSERQERYQDTERNIREYCPLVRKEIERSTKTKKRATGWHKARASLRRY
jgi:hypothetical protein